MHVKNMAWVVTTIITNPAIYGGDRRQSPDYRASARYLNNVKIPEKMSG